MYEAAAAKPNAVMRTIINKRNIAAHLARSNGQNPACPYVVR